MPILKISWPFRKPASPRLNSSNVSSQAIRFPKNYMSTDQKFPLTVKKIFWLVAVPSLLLATLFRWPLLGGSFWLDEAAQALEAVRPWSEQLSLDADFQPPLYHLWLYLWQLVSHQEWWLRLASLIPGVLSISLLSGWWGTRRGVTAAWLLALLLITSSLHVFYSQELRPYMLAVLWFTCSLVCWQQWWRGGKSKWLWLMTLTNAAGALTSYVFMFWWPAQLLVTVIFSSHRRERIILLTRSLLVSFMLWLSWWPWFWRQWQTASLLRQQLPGWEQVVSIPFFKAPLLILGQFIFGLQPLDLNWWFVFILGGIYSLLGFLTWRQRARIGRTEKILIVSLISSFMIAWIFSWWTPVLAAKRVLWLLPLFYLWVVSVWQRSDRWSSLLVAILLLVNITSLYRYWQFPSWQRENWRAAVQQIEENYQPSNTAVVFGFDGAFAPWEWYSQEEYKLITTGTAPLSKISEVQAAFEDLHQYENVVVFDYLRDLTDPQMLIDQELRSEGYELLQVLDYPKIGFIRMYYKQTLFAQLGD